jgi:hypothetical protein
MLLARRQKTRFLPAAPVHRACGASELLQRSQSDPDLGFGATRDGLAGNQVRVAFEEVLDDGVLVGAPIKLGDAR